MREGGGSTQCMQEGGGEYLIINENEEGYMFMYWRRVRIRLLRYVITMGSVTVGHIVYTKGSFRHKLDSYLKCANSD